MGRGKGSDAILYGQPPRLARSGVRNGSDAESVSELLALAQSDPKRFFELVFERYQKRLLDAVAPELLRDYAAANDLDPGLLWCGYNADGAYTIGETTTSRELMLWIDVACGAGPADPQLVTCSVDRLIGLVWQFEGLEPSSP